MFIKLVKIMIQSQVNPQLIRNALETAQYTKGQSYFTLKPRLIPQQPSICANGFSQHCRSCRDWHCILAGGFSLEEMRSNEAARITWWRPIQERFFNMGQLRIKRKVFLPPIMQNYWISDSLLTWFEGLLYTDRNWTRTYNKRGDEK
jgi:hypothetical protein